MRREAGGELRMKEPYGEGVARRTGPESCVGRREAAGEALTGVHADRVLSCEIKPLGVPTPFAYAEGNTGSGATREPLSGPAQS